MPEFIGPELQYTSNLSHILIYIAGTAPISVRAIYSNRPPHTSTTVQCSPLNRIAPDSRDSGLIATVDPLVLAPR